MKKRIGMFALASLVILSVGCNKSTNAENQSVPDTSKEVVTNAVTDATLEVTEATSEATKPQEEVTTETVNASEEPALETTVEASAEETQTPDADGIVWGVTYEQLTTYAKELRLIKYYEFNQSEVINDAIADGIDQRLVLNDDNSYAFYYNSASEEFANELCSYSEELTDKNYPAIVINTEENQYGRIEFHAILPDGNLYAVRHYFDWNTMSSCLLNEIYEVVQPAN